MNFCCPSPHGEGGLKSARWGIFQFSCRPSPHGEGGLKSVDSGSHFDVHRSLPTRGGWIEIRNGSSCTRPRPGPSPHGEGGLKYLHDCGRTRLLECPSPHGEGGLKFQVKEHRSENKIVSLPTRGGWIEIPGGVGTGTGLHESLPTRGGWIEMRIRPSFHPQTTVPPHTGRVD